MNNQSMWIGSSTRLSENTFSRQDYSFTGWNTKEDGSGISYADKASVRDISNNQPTITLYAQWKELKTFDKAFIAAGKEKVGDYYSMQDLNSTMCGFVDEEISSSLVDTRDNHLYTVAKLKDGNCWMVDNLDLGRTALTTDLTPANTNLSTTITAETFNSWKKTSGTATYDAGEFISLDGTDEISGTPYGTLYNYYAASAGTISGLSDSFPPHSAYDICPAGWRLPMGGNNGDFDNLYKKYNSLAFMMAPIEKGGAAFAYVGNFLDDVPKAQGQRGAYWSSTVNYREDMRVLSLYSSYVNPTTGLSIRSAGNAIRCVLK